MTINTEVRARASCIRGRLQSPTPERNSLLPKVHPDVTPLNKMFKSSVSVTLVSILFWHVTQATPSRSDSLTISERQSDPSIKVLFFSDFNCTTIVPVDIYPCVVYGDELCYMNTTSHIESIRIVEIDDQFIRTNSALQISYSPYYSCDFAYNVTFSIATRDKLAYCREVEVPWFELLGRKPGNTYRITTLE